MKWVSHKIVTGSIVFAITGSPILSIVAAMGSIFPDAVEGFPNESNYDTWRKNHRQLSHWFFPYFLVFCLFISFAGFQGYVSLGTKELFGVLQGRGFLLIFSLFAAYFSLGALFHILQDAICGKVPGITREEKFGVKLFKVGSKEEYIVVLGILSFLFLVSKVL